MTITHGCFLKVKATRCFRRCDFVVWLKSQRVACPQAVRPRAESASQNVTVMLYFGETHEVESTWHRMQTNQQQAGGKVDGKKVKHGGVA